MPKKTIQKFALTQKEKNEVWDFSLEEVIQSKTVQNGKMTKNSNQPIPLSDQIKDFNFFVQFLRHNIRTFGCTSELKGLCLLSSDSCLLLKLFAHRKSAFSAFLRFL